MDAAVIGALFTGVTAVLGGMAALIAQLRKSNPENIAALRRRVKSAEAAAARAEVRAEAAERRTDEARADAVVAERHLLQAEAAIFVLQRALVTAGIPVPTVDPDERLTP